jgi:hypothetical protein
MSEKEKKQILTMEDLSNNSHEILFDMEEDEKNRLRYRVNEKAPSSDNHEMLATTITRIENLSKGFRLSDDEEVRSAGITLAELFRSLVDQHTAELLNVLVSHATISDEERLQLKKLIRFNTETENFGLTDKGDYQLRELIEDKMDKKEEKISARQETAEDGPKAEAVRAINEEKKNVEELVISYEDEKNNSKLKEKELEELAGAGEEKAKLVIGVLTIIADSLKNGRIAEIANIVSVDYPKFFADADTERCLNRASGEIYRLKEAMEKINTFNSEKIKSAVSLLTIVSAALEEEKGENITELAKIVALEYPKILVAVNEKKSKEITSKAEKSAKNEKAPDDGNPGDGYAWDGNSNYTPAKGSVRWDGSIEGEEDTDTKKHS